jgi:porin
MSTTVGRHVAPLARLIGLALTLLTLPGPAGAQPLEVPATYGGDLWSRPRLTGDWGGVRDELAKKGVGFDVACS